MVYRVDRNNFYTEQKKATIYTPESVCDFVFQIIAPTLKPKSHILDPAVGAGALLKPFQINGHSVFGVDIEHQGFKETLNANFLALKTGDLKTPDLVIVNPPFNIDQKTKQYIKENYAGRPLLPEVWFQKIIELFGTDVPIILFTPYGFRLNQQCKSKRWQKFTTGQYPEISSIISLPKDVFDGILFHSEILIFNVNGLKGHYFYHGDI